MRRANERGEIDGEGERPFPTLPIELDTSKAAALNGQPSGQKYRIIGASGKPISNAVKGRKKQIRVNLHRVGDTYEEGGAAEENNNFE